MAEYIKREPLIRDLIDNYSFYPALVKNVIERQPTADVVEVVRCKDCVSYNGHRFCNYHADPVMDGDFCSYGERKDGKGEGE